MIPLWQDQLQRRAAFHPAAQSIPLVWKFRFVRVESLEFLVGQAITLQDVDTLQPSSAAVARPVRQRHRSMASCRARATAIFFFKDAPCLSFC